MPLVPFPGCRPVLIHTLQTTLAWQLFGAMAKQDVAQTECGQKITADHRNLGVNCKSLEPKVQYLDPHQGLWVEKFWGTDIFLVIIVLGQCCDDNAFSIINLIEESKAHFDLTGKTKHWNHRGSSPQ